MSSKKNILVLTTSFPYKDQDFEGYFIFELCRRLNKYFENIVLAPHRRGLPLAENFRGVFIHRFRYGPSNLEKLCYGPGMLTNIATNPWLTILLPFFLLSQFFAAYGLIRKNKIALIQAHWIFPSGLIAVILGKLFKINVLLTTHGSDISLMNKQSWRLFAKFIISNTSAVTIPSQPQLEYLKNQIFLNNITEVISMGVDTDLFYFRSQKHRQQGGSKESPILLFVGVLNKNKGIINLINALPKIIKNFSGVVLWVVGSGPLLPYLKQLVLKLKIEESVIFQGSLENSDLPARYRAADVFILPSYSEGVPVAILEAMSSGCPVIASRVGGIPDIIVHKQTGWLINPRKENDLLAGIEYLLNNPLAANKIALAANRAIQERYSWSVVASNFYNLINKLLK